MMPDKNWRSKLQAESNDAVYISYLNDVLNVSFEIQANFLSGSFYKAEVIVVNTEIQMHSSWF